VPGANLSGAKPSVFDPKPAVMVSNWWMVICEAHLVVVGVTLGSGTKPG
jgi:hypothetical protein